MTVLEIAMRLIAHRAELERIWAVLAPVVAEAQKAYPKAEPLIRDILIEFGVSKEPHPETALVYFNTRHLQESLKHLGSPDLIADGDYGPATVTAVKKFQSAHPPLTVDGICGVQTFIAIERALEELGK